MINLNFIDDESHIIKKKIVWEKWIFIFIQSKGNLVFVMLIGHISEQTKEWAYCEAKKKKKERAYCSKCLGQIQFTYMTKFTNIGLLPKIPKSHQCTPFYLGFANVFI